MNTSPSLSSRGRRRINMRYLEAFYAIGVAGTASAAAEMLNLTQPAVSKQIAALEKQIGYALFRRHAGRLTMTTEAKYLFDEVASTLSHLDTLWEAMQRLQGLDVGQLEIGTPPGPSYVLLPRLFRQFLASRPNVRVKLLATNSTLIQRKVSLQRLDFGLVEHAPVSPNYQTIPLDVECYCAISTRHPLASKDSITPQDLDGLPAVTLEPQHPLVQEQRRIFERAGATFNPCYEVSLWWAGFGLVREQLCYAIVDRLNAESFQEIDQSASVVFLPFKPTLLYQLSIIVPTLRPMSTLAESFLNSLLSEFELPEWASRLP